MQTVIDYADGWDEHETGANSILTLREGLALLAARNDPRHDAWRHAAERRGPVYVQFDPVTKSIKALYMSVREMVESVELSTAGGATVTFERAPSFYKVKGERAGGPEMIARLQQAAREHRPVLVISHPSTLEILDVRAAP